MLRDATDADWGRVFPQVNPPAEWFGLAEDGRYTIDGLGGVYKAEDDTWWGFFWRAPHVRKAVTSHRAGRIIMGLAQEKGIKVRVLQSPSMKSAARWLPRIGFEPTGEQRGGLNVWLTR